MNTIKNFTSLSLDPVNLLLWKKLLSLILLQFSNQTHSSACSLLWDQDLQLSEGLRRVLPIHTQNFESHSSVECHCPPKNWILPTFFMPYPVLPLIADQILKKKKSLTDFRLMLPNVLLWVHIFSFIITTYLKNLIGIKLFNTKQHPAKLSPRIMPTRNLHLKNNVHHPSIWRVVITRYGLPSPFLQTLKENAVNEKLIQPRSKN